MTPRMSFVVLSFGRFASTTQACLESLAAALDDPAFELVVVDNGSSDGSAQACAQWAQAHPGTDFIALPSNLGFAGGMNAGAARTHGEWICLVNNDTRFPSGALAAWQRTIDAAPSRVAMLGPVTSAAGNGQQLWWPDRDIDTSARIGAAAIARPTGLLTPTYRTDFFCVAVRRDAWAALGGLALEFGLGYYEDFDFSLRLRAAGFDQAIAEDVFIAHAGSATFSAMRAEQTALMKRNRRLLRDRHPDAVFEHVREGNAAALRHLIAVAEARGWTDALRERAAWRWAALEHDRPRSPFKRWRWQRATRDIGRTLGAAGLAPRLPAVPSTTTAPARSSDAAA